MSEFLAQTAFDIGRRIEIRGPFAWIVISTSAPSDAAEDFIAELTSSLETAIRTVHAVNLTTERLRSILQEPESDKVVILDLEDTDSNFWRALDINRSGLIRSGTIILWLSSPVLNLLCESAPNLRSFIGGSIFLLNNLGQAFTESERGERISEFESHFGMSSSELIHRSEAGTRPSDPEILEWLVLLDRGDLV